MSTQASAPFHLMIKPTGPDCNLACEYCYYLHKREYYPGTNKFRMDLETLERVTAAYIAAQQGPEVVVGWQGGEPLMMGVEFFAKAIEFQRKYARPGQTVTNTLQTNGTLIDDEWAAFFAEHNFLVGISMDGPAHIHDRYRVDKGGHPSHARVLKGLEAMQRHNVEYNALVTVNRGNVDHPLEVYQYLTGLGITFLQFIPIVEREARDSRKVTGWTVRPEPFGQFLCDIFDYWARHDVGRVYVQHFETALSVWLGAIPALCVFAPTCGRGLVVEHNGDLYACDHYVFPEYLLGNITTPESLRDMVDSPAQRAFGLAKRNDLAQECLQCPVLAFCGGDCPKHRVRVGGDGKAISYLCPALKQFFTHAANVLQAMAGEIRAGRPASNVMDVLREFDA